MTRLRLPPELLTGDLDTAGRTAVGDYLRDIIETRGFPLHINVLFNALYFAMDTDVGGYTFFGEFNVDEHLDSIRHNDTAAALPIGAFVEVAHEGHKTLAGEIVYKEGAHPDGHPTDRYAAVAASLVGQPAVDDHVPERVVVDFAAFTDLNIDTATVNLARTRRSWIDEYGHLHARAHYPGTVDDIDHFVEWLLDNRDHRTLLAWCFDEAPDSEMLDAAIRQALRCIRDIVEDRPDLRRWGNYVIGPSIWAAHTGYDTGQRPDASDLTQLRNHLTYPSDDRSPAYRAVSHELRGYYQTEPDVVAGTNYVSAIVVANAWVADHLNGCDDYIHRRPGGTAVHARIDDRWQAGGLWRVDHGDPPPPWATIPVDVALGLGADPDLDELGIAPPEPAPPTDDLDAPEPEPAELLAPDEASWWFPLRPGALDRGLLPIPANVRDRLPPGDTIAVTFSHDTTPNWRLQQGEVGARDLEPIFDQQVDVAGDSVLAGLPWPLDLIPATKLLCHLSGRRLDVSTRRIHPSQTVGTLTFHHQFDMRVAREVAGLPPVTEVGQRPRARSQTLPELIAVAFAANDGVHIGSGRLLTWAELAAAIFGPESVHDDSLRVRIGRTCRNMSLPVRPDGAVWPDGRPAGQTADRAAYRDDTPQRIRHAVSHASESTVRMHLRWVGHGNASYEKRRTYAEARRDHRAESYLPTELPRGYTWVTEHERSGW